LQANDIRFLSGGPGRLIGSMDKIPSEIPVGTQFSPALINLKAFLAAVRLHSGNRLALQGAIWTPPVHKKRSGIPNSRRRANLPLEAAVQYGLLEARTYKSTELTRRLAKLSGRKLREAFARHILLNRGGLRVVEAAEQMQMDNAAGLSDLEVTGDSLARNLTAQGFRVTEHNTAINSMRMWLAEAGLFPSRGWEVNRASKRKLVGMSDEAIGILGGFSEVQRAFLDALCRMNPSGWCKASEVRDLAESTLSVRLGRASLPNEILKPLKLAGLIDYKTKGTTGGKVALLRTRSAFDAKVLQPFVTNTLRTLNSAVSEYYKTRPQDIYAALTSKDKYKKGRALEAYAIHIMRLLHLQFLAWRKRGPETGGAEIDATFAGLFGALPTIWQIQCKNTPSGAVRLEDVSKEIGQVWITRATHVMIVANAAISREAAKFALATMRNSSLSIFLLGKEEFQRVRESPGSLGSILRTQAERIVESRQREKDAE
jgi:hypothetical protein